MKKVCCFAGHSDTYETEEMFTSLLSKAENLILNENVTEFRVGNYGNFDKLSAKVIRKLKEKYPVKLILVVPYLSSEIIKNKEFYEKAYDEILIAPLSPGTPKRLGIIKCNEYIVDTSDFLIYYVLTHTTGADRTLSYALRKKLHIISI